MTVRCRYDEAVTAAAQGDVQLALQLFQAATAVAVEQQDKQLETMAATAVGLLMTGNSQDLQQEEEGWTFLQRSVLQAAQTPMIAWTLLHTNCVSLLLLWHFYWEACISQQCTSTSLLSCLTPEECPTVTGSQATVV